MTLSILRYWRAKNPRLLGGKDADTYFEDTLIDDDSEFVGAWHYLDGGDQSSRWTDPFALVVYLDYFAYL